MHDSIKQFLDICHPFGYPLLACSVILITTIIYRMLFFGNDRLLNRLSKELSQNKQNEQNTLIEESNLGHSFLEEEIVFIKEHRNDKNLEAQVESHLQLFVDSERTGMATISIITNIAPMLGILGTAWGLVDIFGIFGQPDAQESIALGISKALYTTIFGLAIAVPGTIALTCFERSLEHQAARINNFFIDLLTNRSKL